MEGIQVEEVHTAFLTTRVYVDRYRQVYSTPLVSHMGQAKKIVLVQKTFTTVKTV